MASTRLEWAQWMAAKGIGVFIVRPRSKQPLDGYSWYTRQSQDPETIARFFESTPDCNYGLWLGEEYVVVDLDDKPEADGIEAFEFIAAEHDCDLEYFKENTLTVKTPGGGVHLYFKAPFPCGLANEFPEGIDVRGVNGYVIGPGSENTEGVWELFDPDQDIMDLPEWLHDYMRPPGHRDPNHDIPLIELNQDENVQHALKWLEEREPAIEGDGGDQWTYETIQYLRDFGLDPDFIMWALNQGWNERCDPPWGDSELELKIKNAWTYGQNRPGCKSPTWRAQRVVLSAGHGLWNKYLTAEAKAELFRPSHNLRLVVNNDDNDFEIPSDVDDDETDPVTGEPADSFPWFDVLDFARRGSVREYVIREWLLGHGVTHMVAKRGTGKSTVALDMAFHIACDMDWCNHPTAKGWKVIYICGEDDVGMETNVRAWIEKHGKAPDPGRFLVAADVIKLTDQTRLDIRIREMMEWAAGSRVVVFLDTWQRATMGWGKNDQEAMETAIDRAELIATYLTGPLVSLSHPPKDGRMTVKGAGEQEDTSSGIYHLEEVTKGSVKLFVERIKGPGKDNYQRFDLEKVVLEGKDSFGKQLVGLVAVMAGGKLTDADIDYLTRQQIAWAHAIKGISHGAYNDDIYEPDQLDIENVSQFFANLQECNEDHFAAMDYIDNWLTPLREFLDERSLSCLTFGWVKEQLTRIFKKPEQSPVVVVSTTEMMVFEKKNPKSTAKNPQMVFTFKPRENQE